MFFSLFRERERTKRELVARFVPEQIAALRTGLRNSLRSNRSSTRLKAPYSVAVSVNCHSRYRNVRSPLQLPQRGREMRRNLIPATEPESHPCSSAADRGSSPR